MVPTPIKGPSAGKIVLILGIEGTAHTCGVGIVEADPGDPARLRVRANEVAMLRPGQGGIHPREAAEHHAVHLPGLVRQALQTAGVEAEELAGIAFSQGPGLGPCLRTVATAARALALSHRLPLLGVNHCVAHLEVARATTPASDPIMLYASGANTQVIGESRGRYRVFGETLDIGIGNALDKFAREQGIPFPGGPHVERLAREGAIEHGSDPMVLPALPYTVKGMDVAFSGLVTAASALVRKGVPLPRVCDALQEWAFSPLVEVTERALAHTGKSTVVLGGGVGNNRRLQQMLTQMAGERGAEAHWPHGGLLNDNGAMIAWNGLLLLSNGYSTPVAQSAVNQRYRTDEVPLLWRSSQSQDASKGVSKSDQRNKALLTDVFASNGRATGAEAVVQAVRFLDGAAVMKKRVPKKYRHPRVEALVVARRTRSEARFLVAAAQAGVRVPSLLDADPAQGVLVMQQIAGPSLKVLFERSDAAHAKQAVIGELGRAVARLHRAGVVHGDLTTSNVLTLHDGRGAVPVLIDFGLASHARDPEAHAVDLHVLQEALQATHAGHAALWQAFLSAYGEESIHAGGQDAMARLKNLQGRGRYRSVLA